MTRGPVNSHVRRREMGARLRKHRANAGLALDVVADYLDCTPSRVTRIEDGLAALRLAEARDLLDLYRVLGETRTQLLDLAQRVAEQNWWYPYADLIDHDFETLLILEGEVMLLRTHQPNLVPGLLQTYRYGWELMTTLADLPLHELDRRVRLRTARQRVLVRDPAPRLDLVIDEAALRRPVGGPDVMHEQYERLIDVATTPTTTLRIVPLSAGPHRAVGFAFHIFDFEGGAPRVMQIESFDREHFVNEAEEIHRYEEAYEAAVLRALDEQDSVTLLRELAG